jgi:hypothetical protein
MFIPLQHHYTTVAPVIPLNEKHKPHSFDTTQPDMPILNTVNELVAANERMLLALNPRYSPTRDPNEVIAEIKSLYMQNHFKECVAQALRAAEHFDCTSVRPLHPFLTLFLSRSLRVYITLT